MTLFTLIGLLITSFCAVLALLILRFATNSIQRLWGVFNIVVTIWAYGTYLAGMSMSSRDAILSWKLAYLGATFISIIFYHLVYLFCQLKSKKGVILAYIQGIIFVPIILLQTSVWGKPFIFITQFITTKQPCFLQSGLQFGLQLPIWLFITFINLKKIWMELIESKHHIFLGNVDRIHRWCNFNLPFIWCPFLSSVSSFCSCLCSDNAFCHI